MQLTPCVRMSRAHLHPHSSNLDWFCLLNLLLSYSLTILSAPFKAASILICHPLLSALMWSSGRWYTCQWGCRQRPFHPGLPNSFTLLLHWHAGGEAVERRDSCLGLLSSGPFLYLAGWDCVPARSVSHSWTAVQWSRLMLAWYLCTLRIVQVCAEQICFLLVSLVRQNVHFGPQLHANDAPMN